MVSDYTLHQIIEIRSNKERKVLLAIDIQIFCALAVIIVILSYWVEYPASVFFILAANAFLVVLVSYLSSRVNEAKYGVYFVDSRNGKYQVEDKRCNSQRYDRFLTKLRPQGKYSQYEPLWNPSEPPERFLYAPWYPKLFRHVAGSLVLEILAVIAPLLTLWIAFAVAWVLRLSMLSVEAIATSAIGAALLSFFLVIFLRLSWGLWKDFLYSSLSVHEPRLKDLIAQGCIIAPTRAYVGDSQSVYANFQLAAPELKRTQAEGLCKPVKHLELEFQAAGLNVDGDKMVRHVDSPTLSAIWNYSFPSSGNKTINIAVNLVEDPLGRRSNKISTPGRSSVFVLQHHVRVTGLLGASWQPILAIVLAILSSFATIIAQLT